MEKIYQVVPLYKQSLLQKLFKQTPEENSVIEVNNLLASKPIKSISLDEISLISSKYNINIYKTFKRNIYEFYAVYLNVCLKDKYLSDEQSSELAHLKEILGMNENDIEVIHNKIAGDVYKRSFLKAISNGRLNESEKKNLDKLQEQIKLSDKIADKLSHELREKYMRDYLNEIVANERLSPQEEEELNAISKSLMIDLKMDKETRARLDKFKLYWDIESGDLTPKQVDINLQKNESCYFATSVDWHEQRSAGRGISEWRLIDRGQMYLTNKRLIFMGSQKDTNIRLDKILSFTAYADGIELKKETGKSPRLLFKNDIDVFSLLLSRLVKNS